MSNPLQGVRERRTDQRTIEFKWLGAEALVHIPSRALEGNRWIGWNLWRPFHTLLVSFSSGLAIGSGLALYACNQFRSRSCKLGYGDHGEPVTAHQWR